MPSPFWSYILNTLYRGVLSESVCVDAGQRHSADIVRRRRSIMGTLDILDYAENLLSFKRNFAVGFATRREWKTRAKLRYSILYRGIKNGLRSQSWSILGYAKCSCVVRFKRYSSVLRAEVLAIPEGCQWLRHDLSRDNRLPYFSPP